MCSTKQSVYLAWDNGSVTILLILSSEKEFNNHNLFLLLLIRINGHQTTKLKHNPYFFNTEII